jgi:hypothetical protein
MSQSCDSGLIDLVELVLLLKTANYSDPATKWPDISAVASIGSRARREVQNTKRIPN